MRSVVSHREIGSTGVLVLPGEVVEALAVLDEDLPDERERHEWNGGIERRVSVWSAANRVAALRKERDGKAPRGHVSGRFWGSRFY